MPTPTYTTRPRPWVAAIEARIFELHKAAEDDDRVPEAREIITALQEEGHDLQALKDLLLETFVVQDDVTSRSLWEDVEVSQ